MGYVAIKKNKLSFGVVALVDSGATHSFVAQELVQKYQLPVTMDDGMKVTLADGSLVASSTLCQVPWLHALIRGKLLPLVCSVMCYLTLAMMWF